MAAAWDGPPVDAESPNLGVGAAEPVPLVSLHFLLSTLRRRWLVCVLSGALGLLAAGLYLQLMPPPHTAATTLVLAHDPQQDPARAAATDVSLLTTRTVAQRTIDRLALDVSEQDLLDSLTVVPQSSEVVTLRLSAKTDDEAVRRLDVLTDVYLTFRAEQLTAQSDALVAQMKKRIGTLQGEVTKVSQRVNTLSAAGATSSDQFSDAVSQRAALSSQIDALQQSIQDATFRNVSLVAASRAVDPAAAEQRRMRRRTALTLASGLIGGVALAVGVILFRAITTDRLRRRFDVAAALDVSVPFSAGRLTPVPRPLRRLSNIFSVDQGRAIDRRRLAHVFLEALGGPGRSLAVACVDATTEARFAVATAALLLQEHGRTVRLIDLTEERGLRQALEILGGAPGSLPTVLVPKDSPALATAYEDLRTDGAGNEQQPAPASPTEICLVLADLDPGVGADHLAVWARRAVVTVTAGRSSAERVRTAGDLLRTAGMNLVYAVLLRADSLDYSSGERTSLPGQTLSRAAP